MMLTNYTQSLLAQITVSNRSRHRSASRPLVRSKSKINFSQLGIENVCIRCGRNNHKASECRTNRHNLKCRSCGKTGHVQQVCLKTLIHSANKSSMSGDTDYDDEVHQMYGINQIVDIYNSQQYTEQNDVAKYYVTVEINERHQKFEVDSGVGFTLIPRNEFEQLNIKTELQPSSIAFRSYTKNIVVPDGKVKVEVKYNNRRSMEEMYVVPNEYDALLGRSWIRHLSINLQQVDTAIVNKINVNKKSHLLTIEEITNHFQKVFTEAVGCVPNFEVTLQLRENAKPVFYKEREVPYALRDRVEKELNDLEAAGIISKVERSDWGSPLVIIPKADGGVRLCVDYKIGVNKQLVSANYPIRRIDEILNSLKGSKYFCRLDLYKAYLHLRVSEESSNIQTISTHRGTYKVKRLSFGIKTAPAEFNRIIEQILTGLKNTMSYFDDIIVHGATEEECRNNLILCLQRLNEHDLHLNKGKCLFFQTQIEYLGHVIQFNKISKSPAKIRAIVNIPRPATVDDVRRFLGMVTYYSRFIPKLSSITFPLRQLLKKIQNFIGLLVVKQRFYNLKVLYQAIKS